MATTIPDNRATFGLEALVACVNGVLTHRGPAQGVVGVSTDSRRVRAGSAFVALVGERFDGHDHAVAAARAGASVLIVSKSVDVPEGVGVVRVADTLRALGDLGREHRRRWKEQSRTAGFDGKVVGITGSAGKTTTCRAVTAVLQATREGAVQSPPGNLNNAIGVPLVLLGLGKEHGQAVVEIGSNSPGEIAYGAGIAEPDISVLTLVACAHTEGLGSIEAVAREKGSIFEALRSDGVCVANADDSRVLSQVDRAGGARVITFGRAPNADVRVIESVRRGWNGQDVRVRARVGGSERTVVARVPLLGAAGAYATSAALAVVCAVMGDDADLNKAAEGLRGLRAESGRLRPRTLGTGAIVIDDAYNANPASMRDSIQVAAELAADQGRKLTLVLGEMRELGDQSAHEHRVVGEQLAALRPDLVVAVAGNAKHFAMVASEAGVVSEFVSDAAQAADVVLSSIGEDDVILVKGSRSIALERVVAAIDAWAEGRSR